MNWFAIPVVIAAVFMAVTGLAEAKIHPAPDFGKNGRALVGLGMAEVPGPGRTDITMTVNREDDRVAVFMSHDGYRERDFVRVRWLEKDGAPMNSRGHAWLPAESDEAIYRPLPDGSVLVGLGSQITRYKPDGSRDLEFADSGSLKLRKGVQSLAAYPSGGFLAVSSWRGDNAFLERFDQSGRRLFRREFAAEGLTVRSISETGAISVGAWDWESYDGYDRYEGDETPILLRPNGQRIHSFPASYTIVQFRPGGGYIAGDEEGQRLFAMKPDFTPDPEFDGSSVLQCPGGGGEDSYINGFQIDHQGRIVIHRPTESGSCALVRFLRDGSVDDSFSVDGPVVRGSYSHMYMRLDSKGRPILSSWQNGQPGPSVRRLTTSGDLDETFGEGGVSLVRFKLPNLPLTGVSSDVLRDGRVVVAATSSPPWRGINGIVIKRFSRFGKAERTFGQSGQTRITETGWGQATGVSVGSGGRIYVSGFQGQGRKNRKRTKAAIYALDSSGKQDRDFGDQGRVYIDDPGWTDSRFNDVTVDRQGRVLAVGKVARRGEKGQKTDWLVVRLNRSGRPDPTFGKAGIRIIDASGIGRKPSYWNDADNGLEVQVDYRGRIVVGGQSALGYTGQFAAARLDRRGNLDRSFGDMGLVRSYLLSSLGGGRWWPDPVQVTGMAVGPDGRVAVSSGFQREHLNIDYAWEYTYSNRGTILMIDEDGRRVRGFGRKGILRSNKVDFQSLAFDRCNRLIAGGSKSTGDVHEDLDDFSLSRFTSTGLRDRTFGPKGSGSFRVGRGHNSTLSDVSIGRSGRIFTAGRARMASLTRGIAVAAFDPGDRRQCP